MQTDCCTSNPPKSVQLEMSFSEIINTRRKIGIEAGRTFLACQKEELLIQRRLLLYFPDVFQGQEFVGRGSVRALVQSCHYDGERVRPSTDVHPTRKLRPSHKKDRQHPPCRCCVRLDSGGILPEAGRSRRTEAGLQRRHREKSSCVINTTPPDVAFMRLKI